VRDSAANVLVAAFARMRASGRNPAFWRMRLQQNRARLPAATPHSGECGYSRIAHGYLEGGTLATTATSWNFPLASCMPAWM
jgi:hypothetical protein